MAGAYEIHRAVGALEARPALRESKAFSLQGDLCPEEQNKATADREEPEIRRLDLAETMLTLKSGGWNDTAAFPWFEGPDAGAVDRALRLLADL